MDSLAHQGEVLLDSVQSLGIATVSQVEGIRLLHILCVLLLVRVSS